MGRIETVNIALPTEMLDTVNDAVSSGRYASASDVVREALQEWELRQPRRLAESRRLREAWDIGQASGAPGPVDFDEVKRRGRERLAALKNG